MKTETETKQTREIEPANGHGTKGFFLVEPVDARRYGHARSRTEAIRRQNFLLRAAGPIFYNYNGSNEPEEFTAKTAGCSANGRGSAEAMPMTDHTGPGQPAGPNNNGHAEAKPLVVDRHGQDNLLSVDYRAMWTIWR